MLVPLDPPHDFCLPLVLIHFHLISWLWLDRDGQRPSVINPGSCTSQGTFALHPGPGVAANWARVWHIHIAYSIHVISGEGSVLWSQTATWILRNEPWVRSSEHRGVLIDPCVSKAHAPSLSFFLDTFPGQGHLIVPTPITQGRTHASNTIATGSLNVFGDVSPPSAELKLLTDKTLHPIPVRHPTTAFQMLYADSSGAFVLFCFSFFWAQVSLELPMWPRMTLIWFSCLHLLGAGITGTPSLPT